jgi:hypothetical protein
MLQNSWCMHLPGEVERHDIATIFLPVKGSGTNAEEMKGESAETLYVAKL